MSFYSQCVAEFPSAGANQTQCISDALEQNIEDRVSEVAGGLDTFFLIYGGALVYFMQLGFAMLTAGSVRAKNVKNILLWNLLDSCGGGVAYWATGFAFAYGGDDADGKKTFVGNSGFLLMGEIDYEFWFFEFAFACALSSIVAGTVAERCKMQAYLFYSFFLVGFAYPVVSHAFWSANGFLSPFSSTPLWGSGAIDLAGSGPVHMAGGVTALAAALILGPRRGRFYDDEGKPLDEPHEFAPHSVALQFLGTFGLWFGWYGFNPGSTLHVSTTGMANAASLVAVNTTLGAASGALSAMFITSLLDAHKNGIMTYDLTATMNGCLTGLVAITAPCATVEPWAAVFIGAMAGVLYLSASALLVKFKIDDAVDAIPVHMVGGCWGDWSAGLLSTGPLLKQAFGRDEHIGWFYEWGRGSGNFTLMGIQILGTLFIFGWMFTVMGIYFYILNYFNLFRLDPLEEEVGMDLSYHKGAAYDITSAKQEHVDELLLRRSTHGSSPALPKAVEGEESA